MTAKTIYPETCACGEPTGYWTNLKPMCHKCYGKMKADSAFDKTVANDDYILDQYLEFLQRCVDPEAYRDGDHLFYIDIEDGPTIDGIEQAKQQKDSNES